MKSNYELLKEKGLHFAVLEEDYGSGWINTEHVHKASVIFGRNECKGNGHIYEHVSIAPEDGHLPTWTEMTAVKDMFFNDDEECVQIMPRKSEYVNIVQNCLHIWRRKDLARY